MVKFCLKIWTLKGNFRIEPILARIKESPSAVVLPVIDAISESTIQYMGGSHGRFLNSPGKS